jgi:hypothetical protein
MANKKAAGRVNDPVAVLKPGSSDGASNQLKMTGPGPIKPTAVQNFGKRKTNVKVPANLNP